MASDATWIILGLASLGVIGSATMGVLQLYKRDVKKIAEKHKKKRAEAPLPPAQDLKLPDVPVKPQHPLVSVFWCIVIYWFCFAGIIHWMSGDAEVSDTTMMAPVVLPAIWIWGIISSKTLWYIVGAMFGVWWFHSTFIKPLHDKLDQIIELLRGRGY